jgi:sugar phosphate isomerase/epimerase
MANPPNSGSATAHSKLENLLAADNVSPLKLDTPTLRRLVERTADAPLFTHSYPFYFHMGTEGGWGPDDLLTFAAEHGLKGVKCHLNASGNGALLNLSSEQRRCLAARARELGLRWHVEVSSTDFDNLSKVVAVASDLDAESIRCYPRYSGRVSTILPRAIEDLRRFRQELDPASRFRLTVEQHEDLKSNEMVQLVETVGDPRITLLFDTTNMVNVGELPMDALEIQAPWITEVHVKDARILPDRGGSAQHCCRTGTGDIPLARLLAELLLLGEHEPQVRAIGLEEEVNYYSPAFRFPNELPDPDIPQREASKTIALPQIPMPVILADEYRYAKEQVAWARDLLGNLHRLAKEALGEPETS